MDVKISPSWKERLQEEFTKPYFRNLVEFIKDEYAVKTIYPPGRLIFNAFERCAFEDIKVVLLGQDPYHGEGQANGMCFSVAEGVPKPPSLVNIFKELEADLGVPQSRSGNLEDWANQGVLLLNATLTVQGGLAASHQGKGWEKFTDEVIRVINDEKENVVFLLWGNYAKQKGQFINRSKHLVLTAAHPSPFSANNGFFGCRHFSQTNAYLRERQIPSILW